MKYLISAIVLSPVLINSLELERPIYYKISFFFIWIFFVCELASRLKSDKEIKREDSESSDQK